MLLSVSLMRMTREGVTTVESADELYQGTLEHILRHGSWVESVRDPNSIGSAFGAESRRFLEVSPSVISLSNPRARWVWNRARRVSLVNATGLWLWTLGGSNKLDDIVFYNSKARTFSDDGTRLWGAIGKRILGHRNLLLAIVRRLATDLSSRRAALPIFASTDVWMASKDIPCLLSMQFLVRERKLNLVATFRSNDALMVLPYDLFVITMLHELVASMLDLDVGTYTHVCNSMHIYEDQIELAERVGRAGTPISHAMTEMPKATWTLVRDVARSERQVRMGANFHSSVRERIPAYWRNFLTITAVRRAVLNGRKGDVVQLLNSLDEPFASMIRYDPRVETNSVGCEPLQSLTDSL